VDLTFFFLDVPGPVDPPLGESDLRFVLPILCRVLGYAWSLAP